jgi:hypothetical protein
MLPAKRSLLIIVFNNCSTLAASGQRRTEAWRAAPAAPPDDFGAVAASTPRLVGRGWAVSRLAQP